MTKTLTYFSFVAAFVLVILAFITAKSYTQLAIAVVLYPALAYFALKVFPRKATEEKIVAVQVPVKTIQAVTQTQRETVDVADIDKRTFIKLIGAAGLSFFIFSLLGKRVETLLFGGGTLAPQLTGLTNQADSGISTGTSVTDGYKIAEIDEGVVTYYGFTSKGEAWLIMREDTQTNSFRYAKGNYNFPASWTNRENLKYDYYSNLF